MSRPTVKDQGIRPVRIANCSGFYGDRMDALAQQVHGGEVDVITGDYLAEVTMLVLAKVRAKRPELGYATTFLRQIEPVLPAIAERGIKVVVNAGGLNPGGLAEATRQLLRASGIDLLVAHVEGDDIKDRLDELVAYGHELRHLDTNEPFSSWGKEVLTANAYLGGFGIARALEAGADIVVTGRVTDASLAVGAAAWWWNWTPSDFDPLAGAVAAGHVIECGAQATGGNFSGFRTLGTLSEPGFPIAEIDRDGTAVITKHRSTGGKVTVDTVTAQLLYEIGDPAYQNPDVVAHLDTLTLTEVGDDRVQISGTRGTPPPPTTKVAICAVGGWRNSSTVVVTGLNALEKAELLESEFRRRLAALDGIDRVQFHRIGRPQIDPDDHLAGAMLMHIMAAGDEASAGRAFSSIVVELGLSNYPGMFTTGPPSSGTSYGAYWPALLSVDVLSHTVVHPDGSREVIAAGPSESPVPRGSSSAREPIDMGDTRRVALGTVAHARSGDKGGNGNVGIWVTSELAWEWLSSTLSIDCFRQLVPEAADLPVERYEMANIRALNFVVKGLLDGGATETLRLDKQAKALGEWVRARHIDIPNSLLSASLGLTASATETMTKEY